MKIANVLLALITLLAYYSANIPPSEHFFLALIAFLLPLLLLCNVLLAIYWSFKCSLMFLLSIGILLIGHQFIFSTIAVNFPKESFSYGSFGVLNYNVSFFKKPHLHYFENDKYSAVIPEEVNAMKEWLSTHSTDIMCFQEFYNDDNSSIYNTVATIMSNKDYNYYFSNKKLGVNQAQYGLITFSKFPIVDKGDIFISDNNYNRATYVDLKMPADTLRVINIHLQSMELRGNNPLYAKGGVNGIKNNITQLLYKLKNGLLNHENQVKDVMQFVRDSPYKVLLCGDFNESPYSYIYQYIRSEMQNAFEVAGQGFGFSYNGNTLFFLRIDHQFFQDGIEIINFQTYDNINYSEHHPIKGVYAIPSP